MKLETIMLSKREKDKYSDFTHIWNLKNEANKQREKQRETPRNRLLTTES